MLFLLFFRGPAGSLPIVGADSATLGINVHPMTAVATPRSKLRRFIAVIVYHSCRRVSLLPSREAPIFQFPSGRLRTIIKRSGRVKPPSSRRTDARPRGDDADHAGQRRGFASGQFLATSRETTIRSFLIFDHVADAFGHVA